MDPDVQKSLEESYANPATFPDLANAEYPQTAAIVIAPDGSVKGMIGGNEKTSNRLSTALPSRIGTRVPP